MLNLLLNIEAFRIASSIYFHANPAQSKGNFGRGSHWEAVILFQNLEVACRKIHHSGS